MPAIFVSHSSRDQEVAGEITAALRHLHLDEVFLDFDADTGVGAGADWEKTLYEKIARCHAVVLVLTPNWLASHWCRIELATARQQGKVILPVICSALGDRYVLPEIQSVELIDWKTDGIARVEKRLRAVADELARGFPLAPHRPPYPGIHAFEAEDAAIYFGRDEETRSLIEKLDARRALGGAPFVLLIGASGAGKSSLLKAGVLPQLARRRTEWLPLPAMRPEKAPLEAFAKTLAQRIGKPDDWRGLHATLGGADATKIIADLLKDLRVDEARAATVLVPIDQFEEVFTIAEPGERAAFLALLANILDPARGLPLMAVATGRADVLQGLVETSPLAALIDTVPLLPLPLDRVPRLVEGPAAVASLLVEKGLSEAITRDVENPEALPLLAYTLRLLNDRCPDKRLTLVAYRALGEGALNPVQNAVRRGADEAIERLKPSAEEMAALRDAFVPHLVRLRLDDKRHVRAPAVLAAVPPEAQRLIRALVDARLLTTRTQDGAAIVEVAHEALFSAWPTLNAWLGEEQEFLADMERLKGAHETWTQAADAVKPQALMRGLLLARARDALLRHPRRFSNRDDLRAFIADSAAAEDAERERGQRMRRRVFQAVASAAVIFAFAAAASSWLYFEANNARRDAERQRAVAEVQTRLAVRREQEAQREREEAERQKQEAERQRSVAEDQTKLAVQREQEAEREREEAERQKQEASRERDRAERNFSVAKEAADDVVFKLAQGLRNVAGMRTESVRVILDTARVLIDQLAMAAPEDLELQRSRSAMLSEFASTYVSLGDLTRAGVAADEGLAIARKLAAADPGNAQWQRDVSVSLNKIGNVRLAAGNRAGALSAYEESLAIVRKLAVADPGNTEWQRDVSVSLNNIGNVQLAAGDHAGALSAYEQSLATARKLAAADPGNTEWQRDVSVSLNKIGNVRLAAGNRAGALAAYEEDLAIMRKLAVADPGNTLWQRDVSVSLNKVGDVRLAAGDRAGALSAYEQSLAIVRKLAAADPGNTEWQRDVSVSLNKIGNVRLAAGDGAGALSAYEEDLAIARKLAAADPSNTVWQRDVSVSLNTIGNVRLAAGDRAGALSAYEEDLAIARKLAAADPGNAGWQTDLVVSLYKVSTAAAPRRAREVLTEAISIADKLAQEDKVTADQKGWPQLFRAELRKLPR